MALLFQLNYGVLDVTSNCLTSISVSLFHDLFAAKNNLSTLIIEFPFLLIVNWSGNQLNEIPSNVYQMKSLDMSFNLVTSIKMSTFVDMADLVKLYVASNLIKIIEPYSFRMQNNLETLDLSNNRLRDLNNDTFCGLFSLIYLSLKRKNLIYLSLIWENVIQSIQTSLFRELVNLIELYLGGNPIKLVEDESFFNLNFLRVLELDSFDLSAIARFRQLKSEFWYQQLYVYRVK
jgi:Leucine-rich repeat (LRR) protein